jgi:uncharacterized protein
MDSIEQIKDNISNRIKGNFKVKDIILYGSWARNENNEDSDIDIVVILDEEGVNFDFDSTISKRVRIAKVLEDLKEKTQIDNLVYTKDEWEILTKSDNNFIKQIINCGVSLV